MKYYYEMIKNQVRSRARTKMNTVLNGIWLSLMEKRWEI
jgi:hypothetical protein